MENRVGLLSWCVLYKQFERARFLLARGADIDAMNPNDTNALELAIANRQPASVAFCFEAGAALDCVAIADLDGNGRRPVTADEVAAIKDEDCLQLIKQEQALREARA